MKIRRVFIFLCTLLAASPAWGRGGGGCLEEGTLIATPAGQVPIEQLRAAARWAVVDGELQPATIQATVEVDPTEYVEITAAGRILRVTAEHPLQIDREFSGWPPAFGPVTHFTCAKQIISGQLKSTPSPRESGASRLQPAGHARRHLSRQ